MFVSAVGTESRPGRARLAACEDEMILAAGYETAPFQDFLGGGGAARASLLLGAHAHKQRNRGNLIRRPWLERKEHRAFAADVLFSRQR